MNLIFTALDSPPPHFLFILHFSLFCFFGSNPPSIKVFLNFLELEYRSFNYSCESAIDVKTNFVKIPFPISPLGLRCYDNSFMIAQ